MKQKDILIIVILFFIFSLVWIGSSIYHSAVSSTISEDMTQNIAPIDPTFDTKNIEKLKTRGKVSPSLNLQSVSPTPIILPSMPPLQNSSQEGKLLL